MLYKKALLNAVAKAAFCWPLSLPVHLALRIQVNPAPSLRLFQASSLEQKPAINKKSNVQTRQKYAVDEPIKTR